MKRTTLRPFTVDDWQDVHEFSDDWSRAPGPAFDKWPKDEASTRQLTEHFAAHDQFVAVALNGSDAVIGLIAVNDVDERGNLDLGHVLHSGQSADIGAEALRGVIEHLFATTDISGVITHNHPNYRQLAPLISIGFQASGREDGELVLSRDEWGKA